MIARIAAPLRHGRHFVLLGLLLGALLVGHSATPGTRKLDSLNFVNANIPLVLKALADISGANIVIAPGVQGTITLNLKDVTVEEALDIVTKMAGLAYVNVNGAYLINTPANLATSLQDVNRDYRVINAKSLAPNDIQAALSITYPDISVKVLPPDNTMVLVGKTERLAAALTFIDTIDVAPSATPGATQTIATAPAAVKEELYRVKSIVPWQAKQYLEQSFGARGLKVSYGPGTRWMDNTASAGSEWTSDVLILRGPQEVLTDALAGMHQIDEDIPVTEKRVRTKRIFATQAIAYLLQRFDARGLTITTAPMTPSEIAQISGDSNLLTAASKVGALGQIVKRTEAGGLNIAEPIGDFILSGPEKVVEQALVALETIDIGPEKTVHIYKAQHIEATEAKKQLEELYGKEGLLVSLAPAMRGKTPAESTTSAAVDVTDLVLRGPDRVVANAVQLLSTLDVEPPQVSINTEIISMDASEIENLGIQWGGVSGGETTTGAIGVNLKEQQNPDIFTLGRIVRSQFEINATINALRTRNKAKVINRPSTVIQNGREASIHVGDEIYIEQLTGYSDTGRPLYSITAIDTGVSLKVRPLVSEDGIITLEISTEVTEPPTFRRGASGADLPTLSTNESVTVVKVRNNETLVIGGLVQNRTEEVRQEVPILSKIPLLGKLFVSSRTTPSQQELLILVTPSLLNASGAGTPQQPAVPVVE